MATVVNLLCISKLLRIDLKHSHHKKVMWGGGCVNYFDWVIILQYMYIPNYHTVHFIYIYNIFVNYFSIKLKKITLGLEFEKLTI